MRISTTNNYYEDLDCPLGGCDRRYCEDHRLLYRDCDTAYTETEGDREVINGTRTFMTSDGECPMCQKESENKKWLRLVKEQNPGKGVCELCLGVYDNVQAVAMHLVSYHDWTVEEGHDWLREQVQEETFYGEP